MTREEILAKIEGTGIRMEKDFAVPINGDPLDLPYQIVRTKETVTGSDNGNVNVVKIDWAVALFVTDRDTLLEAKILKALQGVGKVEVIPYPDGTPYSTHFKFTTNQILR